MRRVPTTEEKPELDGGGPKSGRVQCSHSLKKPLFGRLFRVLAVFSSIDLVQKVAGKKSSHHHQTEKIWPIWSSAGTGFRSPKTQIPPAKSLKRSPKSKSEILLTGQLIGTFGSTVVGTPLKLRLRRKKAGSTTHLTLPSHLTRQVT